MASFPAHLVPAARSAYRAVLRASRITFQGDQARRVALNSTVRQTFSSPTLTPPPSPSAPAAKQAQGSEAAEQVSPEEVEKRIGEWKEVAAFLRKNVVQGQLDETGAYRLRVTPDTELGDNASVRDPPKLPTTPFPNRNRRKCGEA
ncbi:hypothetical protein DB88DRAFT_483737 [Papiliotrema laurentii]|uniref:Mitochondrial zinc maintenance protein 1, mitochondrial n=1 Tax=Papiliotrema laurentii TaxID=5418 RepID=A0AAD9FSI7_PAPLA|nr:hypothetical protein DB88DRAFT_483737 [Papiliotrema laurentii]